MGSPVSFWKLLAHSLSHHADRERAEAARKRIEDAIDEVVGTDDADRASLAKETLFHNGEPLGHVVHLLDAMRRGDSIGWDEASYDVEGERVVITFVDASVESDRATLIAWLERVRVRLERL